MHEIRRLSNMLALNEYLSQKYLNDFHFATVFRFTINFISWFIFLICKSYCGRNLTVSYFVNQLATF